MVGDSAALYWANGTDHLLHDQRGPELEVSRVR